MSGIEIAGLILGAIPLVIAALEHHEKVTKPMRILAKYQGEFFRALTALRSEHALFEQNVELLLGPITTARELTDMLDNTNSSFWSEPRIILALQNHLGRAYPAYVRTVSEIRHSIESIAVGLEALPGAGSVHRDGLESLISQNAPAKVGGISLRHQFSKKLKFTMQREELKQTMSDLRVSVVSLERFVANARMMAGRDGARGKSAPYHYPQSINAVRQNTVILFKGLSKAWCSMHVSHATALLLHKRRARRVLRGERQGHNPSRPDPFMKDDCFSLLLGSIQDPMSMERTVTEVRILKTSVSPISQQSVLSFNGAQLSIVTDLCSTLRDLCKPCIGLCIDGDGLLRGSYDLHGNVVHMGEGTRLGDLLRVEDRMLLKECYELAITLTSSLLQLTSTPWMTKGWDKEQILFQQVKGSNVSAQHCLNIGAPYLMCAHDATVQVNDPKAHVDDSSKLLALGIMLIEICEGSPIESLIQPYGLDQITSSNVIIHLLAGQKWLDIKRGTGEITRAFIRSVEYCLKSYVGAGVDLATAESARSLEENVLEPLEEEMHLLFDDA